MSQTVSGELGYLQLLEQILEEGERKPNRTGTDTIGIFGAMLKFNLAHGFPLLTTKRVFWKGVAEELLWFIRGEQNIYSLQARGVKIWDEWAKDDGYVGPVYGKQWRNWEADEVTVPINGPHGSMHHHKRRIDQLEDVIARIKKTPNDRRLIVSAWNVADIPKMGLPPCHVLYQFSVTVDKKLNCAMYQRSADMFLGVPFNIASYALLMHMVAKLTGLTVGTFTHFLADAHIYVNHVDQVREQCSRELRPLPFLHITGEVDSIDDFKYEDFEIRGYNPHPPIKGEVAI